jgi:signal transduction histidine kinase
MKNFSRYIYAILAVPVIILMRFALMPLIGPGVPYVTLFPISVAVAMFAGMGPAILTGFLGSLAIDYYFIPPLYSIDFDIPSISRIVVVVLTSAFVGYVGDMLRAARKKAEQQASDLRNSEQQLRQAHNELGIRVKERTAELDETVAELQKQVQYRIKAEETVKAERKRLENVLEMMPAYAVLLTPDYHVAYANRTFRDWFGDDNGRKCYEFLFNRTESCENCETYNVMKTGKSQFWEWTGPNGRNYDIYDYPFTDTDGSPLIMEIGVDVTAHKRARAELEKYRLHLEDLVKNRTEELARSNNDLEQFAYVASHDLQEPLRAVAGFVELLRRNLKNSLDDKTTEYINFTIDGARRMQTLISGLLEYSRIGTQGKKPQKVNSKEVLDEALARLQAGIEESGAKITADNLPTVYFDDVQLSQLFQNLIGNAIKFRGEKTPRIHINASQHDDAWQFAVTDNGIGIELQYADRIFQIFQRLHSREKYPGTGIGLSICKKIVERHNGKIWVESKPGSGSTFYFTVPDKEGA